MKSEVGANPMWHGSIILSVQMSPSSPVQVIDSVGFYGITPCSDTNPVTRFFKKKTGMNIDLTGGYGALRHEEMRFLDKGEGLEGITFHISQQRFQTLRENINDDIKQQEDAITDAVEIIVQKKLSEPNLLDKIKTQLAAEKQDISDQGIKKSLIASTRKTALPSEIYSLEHARAKKLNLTSRLKPFEFRSSWTPFTLLTFADSNTCKNVATDILHKAQLPFKWLQELGIQGTFASIPRFSGKANAEDFQLYSTGEYFEYQSKKTNKTIFFKKWQPELSHTAPNKTKLFWAVPPNKIIADHTAPIESQKFIDQILINPKLHDSISKLVLQLQKTNEILIQSSTANQHENIDVLLCQLRTFIQAFNQPQKNKNHDYVKQVFDDANNLLNKISLALNKASTKSIELISKKTDEPVSLKLELTTSETQQLAKLLKSKALLSSEDRSTPSKEQFYRLG